MVLLGVIVVAILIAAGLYYAASPTPATLPGTVNVDTTPLGSASSTVTTTSTTTVTTATSTTPRPVAFRIVDTGTHAANVDRRKNVAVFSKTEYDNLWRSAKGVDAGAPPKVDFSKEYVIGVFAGTKPTGGYSIAVTSVIDAGTTRTLMVTISKPGEGCIVTQALTSPYQIIVVPKNDLSLANRDTETSTTCP
jgi:hypothetical protein